MFSEKVIAYVAGVASLLVMGVTGVMVWAEVKSTSAEAYRVAMENAEAIEAIELQTLDSRVSTLETTTSVSAITEYVIFKTDTEWRLKNLETISCK